MKNTWHKHDQRKMTPPFRQFLLLEKQSEQVIPFAQFSGLCYGFEIMFGRLHASYFVAELKIVYVVDITVLWIVLLFCEFKVISPVFLSLIELLELLCRAETQVALSLHSHDASSYFYSRVFVIVFKITDVPPRAVLLLSLVPPLRAFFVTVPAFQHYFCRWSPRSELLFCWLDRYPPILFIWAVGCQ